ncbi:MAG: OsmC family protein [Spirochaetales bacterium]|jgi:putative redox protein|nr:OsmC family protein [Spirochaetales bacterium]
MTHSISCTWLENMAFETEVTGHKFIVDADESVGGEDRGPRPKPLILSALAGCTGMDVIYVLRKMKIEPVFFNMRVDANLTEEHPKQYDRIHLIYEFKESDNLDKDKVKTAVELSQEKYCGVNALLKKGAEVSFEILYL